MTDPNLSLGGNSHPIKIIPEDKTIRFLRDLITKFALASTYLGGLYFTIVPATVLYSLYGLLTIGNNRLHSFAQQIAHYFGTIDMNAKTKDLIAVDFVPQET